MGDRKTIQFNSELFSFPSKNATRKKRSPTSQSGGMRIKSAVSQKREDTMRKRSILRELRNHQENEYNKRVEPDNAVKVRSTNPDDRAEALNEFKQAETYLSQLLKKTELNNKYKNHTIKERQSGVPSSLLFHPDINPLAENVSLSLPPRLSSPMKLNQPNALILPPPKYGILKNGTLPTIRSAFNQTRRSLPQDNIHISNAISGLSNELQNEGRSESENKLNENIKRMSEIKQTMARLERIQQNNKPKPTKQRRIITRTHKVGKSKVLPKIGVLVSNKTIRNNISTKTQLMKQTSMEEIKKYLIKRGLIKVGSTAPNDVLRKMYESAQLICGEIQNHNPDNLLYNFLHGQ